MSWKNAIEMCNEKGHSLLYLCKFGSHLYGTHSEYSDTDYKGIFLPSKESLLLGEKCKSLHFSSGNNRGKNTIEDVDIDLWSLHYFLELVKKGETNALDLLFSLSNLNCLEHIDERMYRLFKNPLRLFNPYNANAFIGYATGQAKKYGLKGTKVGILKRIVEYLEGVEKEINERDWKLQKKLREVAPEILHKFKDDSYCFNKIVNDENALVICGKVHLYSITLEEFIARIKREYEKFGERAKLAEQNDSVDWKAVSHAKRAIDQMKELLLTGKIVFPLKTREEIKKIKNGVLPWKECEKLIVDGINEIDELKKTIPVAYGFYDSEFVRSFILNFYK